MFWDLQITANDDVFLTAKSEGNLYLARDATGISKRAAALLRLIFRLPLLGIIDRKVKWRKEEPAHFQSRVMHVAFLGGGPLKTSIISFSLHDCSL